MYASFSERNDSLEFRLVRIQRFESLYSDVLPGYYFSFYIIRFNDDKLLKKYFNLKISIKIVRLLNLVDSLLNFAKKNDSFCVKKCWILHVIFDAVKKQ